MADSALAGALASYVRTVNARYGKGLRLGLAVADASTNKEVYSHNGDVPLKPASILKIVTTFAALRILGSERRFPTEIFADVLPSRVAARHHGGGDEAVATGAAVGNIYVRGYGDPGLVEERLSVMARQIANLGVGLIDDIVIDDSLFVAPRGPLGERPFQAGLSATALNHNCYAVNIAPGVPGAPAYVYLTPGVDYKLVNKVVSHKGKGQSISIIQTPPSTSAALRKRAEGNSQPPPITVTVQGRIGTEAKPIAYYRTVPDPARYLGSVLRYYLERAGISVRGEVRLGEVPAKAEMLNTFKSDELKLYLRDLNHYSNNFVAEQLLYAMGQDEMGYFRRELAIAKVEGVLGSIGISRSAFTMIDGSGLDRGNQFTARQMVRVLSAAYDDLSIAPDFMASLSRFSQSGTLKKRKLFGAARGGDNSASAVDARLRRAEGVWGKTGTLNGLSSLAGYAESEAGERLAFAIIVSGPLAKATAMSIENEVARILIGTR